MFVSAAKGLGKLQEISVNFCQDDTSFSLGLLQRVLIPKVLSQGPWLSRLPN